MSLPQTLPERVYAQVMTINPQRIDQRLPYWARRANPIVRWQLGVFWKAMTPDLSLPVRLFAWGAAIIVLTWLFPSLFNLLLPVVTVPVILLPVALYFYAEILFKVGQETAGVVADQVRKEQFTLLRLTPMPLIEMLAAKGAAAVWRQIETLDLLVLVTVILSFPIIILQHVNLYPPAEYPIASRLLIIAGLAVSMARVLLEPMMMAALGVAMGAATRARVPAVLATALLGFAYFVLVNLPRLLLLEPGMRFVLEMVLPLALPPLISYGALRLAAHLISRD